MPAVSMASVADLRSALDAIAERKSRLHKSFTKLPSPKIGASWKDIDDRFKNIEASLRKVLDDYSAKEKALHDTTHKVQAELQQREADISSKEQASLARVQAGKDAAVATILEQKRKWSEEKKKLAAGGSSAEQAPAATKKEKPASTTKAASMDAKPDSMSAEALVAKADDVSPAFKVALSGLLAAGNDTAENTVKAEHNAAAEKTVKADNTAVEVAIEPRKELKVLFQNMDSAGLRKFLAEHRTTLIGVSVELPAAFKLASDPAQLMLQVLEGYCVRDEKSSKDEFIADRRVCVFLLEALEKLHPVLSVSAKKSAKEVADRWKSRMDLQAMNFSRSLEAQSFLQLLSTFDLGSEYSKDELCEIVSKIARRKQTPVLVRSLGLSEKAGDVVEKLIKSGKQIDAVVFAKNFDLFERYPPVPMLKASLKEARKAAQAIVKGGNKSRAAQNEANQKELAALKVVLSVINECNLGSQYSPDALRKRIDELEKDKEEKKRSASISKTKQPMKKIRSDESQDVKGPQQFEKSSFSDRDRVPRGGVNLSSYLQPGLDRSLGAQGSGYDDRLDGLSAFGYRSPAYSRSNNSYSAYNYTSALARTPSAYSAYW